MSRDSRSSDPDRELLQKKSLLPRRAAKGRRADGRKTRPKPPERPGWERPVQRHPLFGDIPMIEEVYNHKGKPYTARWHDPGYRPALPPGAVRGDPRQQVYCLGHHVPKYFYVDEERECVQCGASFSFRAAEQKYWYETRKFNFASVPIRCLTCRRRRQSERSLRQQIANAKDALRKSARDPAVHLSLAQAIVEYRERTGQGSLNEAVAAARKAAAQWPESRDALYWEGAAHALAGRRAKARQCLEAFLSRSDGGTPNLVKKARVLLSGLPSHP